MSEDQHAFADVDRSTVAPHLVRYLDAVANAPSVREFHDRTDPLLAPKPGERVLEVGTGLGGKAREIARAVAPTGSVVAVDVSETMLNAARERHDPALPVMYERADVLDLPYDDASFDAIRIERVLQHVTELDRAAAEMARVLKPGGRVLALDTDWGSLAVDLADTALVARVLDQARTRMPSPRAALALRRLLCDAGLDATDTTGYAFAFTSLAEAGVLIPMVNPDVPREAKMVPDADREQWFAALHDADARGAFLAGFTMYTVRATKP